MATLQAANGMYSKCFVHGGRRVSIDELHAAWLAHGRDAPAAWRCLSERGVQAVTSNYMFADGSEACIAQVLDLVCAQHAWGLETDEKTNP